MKLSTALMFDGNVERFTSKIQDLEAAGVDMVLIPEIYGFDQVSVLGYIAAKTDHIELMTGIVNVYSRSPALIAQSAATIDALSGGRFTLGRTGRRGLAWRSVQAPARANSRHCRHLSQGLVRGQGHPRWQGGVPPAAGGPGNRSR